MINKILLSGGVLFLLSSCLKHGSLYQGPASDTDDEETTSSLYLYPFDKENSNITAEITLQTKGNIDPQQLEVEIPPLKYNKSLLFILSQDDCKHASYSCTFASINGRPLSKGYFYNFRQYLKDDLPPDTYYLGKTLGSTDGAGNEVRFSFTATLFPEGDMMKSKIEVSPGFTSNYFRFFMKSGLVWDNVTDMINYGTGIAFHDINSTDVNNPDSILYHYGFAQDIILKHLSGRGCKTLAEPNGNKNYIKAAQRYEPIQIMTAQTQAIKLYPLQVESDLQGQIIIRGFSEVDYLKRFITEQSQLPKEDREAICVGVHGTDPNWATFFLWLNDSFGKDGDDSIWFTSLEEYYEYNYYRQQLLLKK